MGSGHSILAPSAASRWTVCTASVGFIEELIAQGKIPREDPGSAYADEGTLAHSVAAAMLLHTPVPEAPVDMLRHCTGYVNFIRNRRQKMADEQRIETKVPLFYVAQDKGTVDCYTIDRENKRLYIDDFKYGAGVGVYAKENKQLAIYAESLIRTLKCVDTDWLITLSIYQPRDRNDDNPVRLWALTRLELYDFCEQITNAALAIKRGDVEFHPDPSGACYWCRAKGLCEHFRNFGLSALPDETRIIDPSFPRVPEPKMLTREQRIRVILGRRALEQWLEAVEDYEVAQLMANAEPHGLKLVEGKSNRFWKEENKAATILYEYLDMDQVSVPQPDKLISVAEAEALIGKKEFAAMAPFIGKPPGKPTLVPVDDKRPALTFGPSRDFENLDAKVGSEFI